jgi:hypothetical protein
LRTASAACLPLSGNGNSISLAGKTRMERTGLFHCQSGRIRAVQCQRYTLTSKTGWPWIPAYAGIFDVSLWLTP